ncbi:MAG: hypothetical protein ACR2PL_10215 [Dehalococcoidia bacterium]
MRYTQSSTDPYGVGIGYDGQTLTLTASYGMVVSVQPPNDRTCTDNGSANVVQCLRPRDTMGNGIPIDFTTSPATCGGSVHFQLTASYQPGWNLIAAPPGTVLSELPEALYTLQPGDTGYEQVDSRAETTACYGYWAYSKYRTIVGLPAGNDVPYSVGAPPNQLILIGDASGRRPATVTGADAVYADDSASGVYQQTGTLQPGQGAWVYSAAGGTVSITPIAP